MARDEQEKKGDGLEEKVLFVNRCAKVLKGGRKFSFSALIAVGDMKGKVGFGFAKANDLTDAIRKARELAGKNVITFEMQGSTIPHDIRIRQDGVDLMLRPAPVGAGIIAGSKVRSVLELAGVKDVVAKNMGSSNPMNQVRAIFAALKGLKNREEVKAIRRSE